MNTNSTGQQTVIGWHCEGTFPALFTDSVSVAKRWMELGSKVSAMVRQEDPATVAAPAAGDPRDLPELNADLIDILGRPNFTCIRIAQLLRLGGVEIAKKAEAEQATVIHYLLGFYFKHGSQWAEKADEDIERRRATAVATRQHNGND
ncbi:hypothetical protein D3C87_1254560 [compost metagenome]